MITVRLLGGLGNQMFQYAFGQAVAAATGLSVNYDRQCLIERTHREYSLDHFWAYVPLAERAGATTISQDQTKGFDKNHLDIPDGSVVTGYWQSEKYFEDIETEIRKALVPSDSMTLRKESKLIQSVTGTNSVSIHVRRKDYLDLMHFHGMPSMEYYRSAMDVMREAESDPKFFVFSDDREWCLENFKDCTVVDGTDKYEDLWLMSHCKHAIIANSSFSWWGAWLNPDKSRIVIVPNRWFAVDTVNTTDLIPARWIKI